MGQRYSKHRHKPQISKQQIPWLLRGAIRSNNVETLTYLFSYPNDVDPSMVIDGVCPLNLAVELGHVQMVKLLLKAGANIHVYDAPTYPLLQAATYGRTEIIELLVKSNADVNMRNQHLQTGLHLIATQTSEKYRATCRALLQNDCNPNLLDTTAWARCTGPAPRSPPRWFSSPASIESGDTALTSAVKDRREAVVGALLKSESLRLEDTDQIGMTPLMIAAELGASGVGLAALLLAAGSSASKTDKQGMTALHHAAYTGCLSMTQLLLGQGNASINSTDSYGRSPLYLATSRGHVELVNYFLSKGADVHLPNKELKSPMYIAAYFGHLEIVQALLRSEADVDQPDTHKKTPLYVATYHGRTDIVDLLLRHGSDVNAARPQRQNSSVNRCDKDGLAPLHMAVKFPKLDIPMVKLLLSHGCDPLNLQAFTRWLLENQIIPDKIIYADQDFLRLAAQGGVQRALFETAVPQRDPTGSGAH
uniref:ANK_REP_REGION domain-containing protein n=1 Tax=Macrostomum lignano TaxID=282301 RepID=A0A1I8IVE6_9PLAT